MSNQEITVKNQSLESVDQLDDKAELYIWRMANFTLASLLAMSIWGLPALIVSALIASLATGIFIASLIMS